MADLVPGPGFAFVAAAINGGAAATAMGPFSGGSYLDRLRVVLRSLTIVEDNGCRLGFSVVGSPEETLANLKAGQRLWFARDSSGARTQFGDFTVPAGYALQFDVDLGIRVGAGARWVLVYHRLLGGSDVYEVHASLRTQRVVRSLAAEV